MDIRLPVSYRDDKWCINNISPQKLVSNSLINYPDLIVKRKTIQACSFIFEIGKGVGRGGGGRPSKNLDKLKIFTTFVNLQNPNA